MNRRALVAVAFATSTMLWLPQIGTAADSPDAAAGGGASTKAVPVSSTGSYVVVMKADPLVRTFATDQLATASAEAEAASIVDTHTEVMAEAGVDAAARIHDYTNALNGFSVVVGHDAAVALAANPNVAAVLPDELRQAQQIADAAAAAPALPPTRSQSLNEFLGLAGPGNAYSAGVNGEGVVVGVIDTGIWPEHPSFADDGTYPAGPELSEDVRSACDFGNTAHNPDDAPFTCNNKLVGARQMLDSYRAVFGVEDAEFDSARDDDGHGTHTASTAAGNADVQASIYGRYVDSTTGIAPRAQVIAYKGLGALGGLTSDLAAAIDQAVEDGVDVINYSIGGGPSLTSADALSFLFAADAGVFVATSAGNSGPGAETIGGPADLPWVTTVGASTQDRFYQGTVRLGNGVRVRGSSITPTSASMPLVDAGALGNELCLQDVWEDDDPAIVGKMVLCKRGASGRSAKSRAVELAGGEAMILYNAVDEDSLFTDNFRVPTVMTDYSVGLTVLDYINKRGADATAKIVETAKRVETVPAAPAMTYFSSRGPNPSAPDIIKPDITAPGIQVLAGASPFGDYGGSDFTQGELFQAIAGTSMSSPVVAGLYALIKQVHPDWSPAAAKSALMTSSSQDVLDNDRVSPADPFDFGAGHANVGKVNTPGAFNPGLVYDAGFFEYLGFYCGTDAAADVFANPARTCGNLAAAGVPTRTLDLNLSSIGMSAIPGTETVIRTVTNVSGRPATFRSKVTSPAGYTVTVEPSVLVLAPGESATFEVTATNTGGAPLGEWFFGSLDWKSGRFLVHSPIAVRGVALSAPSSVTGNGVEGTADIPVKFGYTGAYSAEASGLAALTPLTGTVEQDPDQTFGTGDDTPQNAVPLPLTFASTTYARFAIDLPDDEIDLDLYLVDDATGDIVAASTAGGTHELIELFHPADGAYTLFVHGWAVGDTPLDFSLDSWTVSAGAGSLSVVSAPTEATTGAAATVTVGWAGLDAGSTYFGLVDHIDDSGVAGVTVVEVTT